MKALRYNDRTGYPTFRDTDDVGTWNLFRNGVTSTLIDSFLECREQTRLGYVQGWTPHSVSWSLEYGSCIHWVLEQAYGMVAGNKVTDLGPDWMKLNIHEWSVPNWVTAYRTYWLGHHPDATTDALAQQEEIYGYANAVLPSYFRRWCGDFTGDYSEMENTTTRPVKYVSAEGQFKVWYTYSDGLQVPVQGRRDVVFADARDAEWVLDTKTMSIVNDDDILDSFEWDFQQNLYLWVRRKETGKMPAGAIKNVLRTPAHRQKQGEPLNEFCDRIAADVGDPKQWDTKQSGQKRIAGWFIRYQLSLSAAELDNWTRTQLDPIMRDVRDWFEGRTAHYPAAKHAIGKYGRCNLFNPMLKGDFSRVYQRDRPFPELD